MKKSDNSENVAFSELELSPSLLKALKKMQFEYCSPIQAQSLPHSLRGHDVLGKAQTGTGKTAAFLLAVFDGLLQAGVPEERYAGEARALILAPTRELALQIAKDAKAIGEFAGLSVHSLVGGVDYGKQLNKLRSDFVDIIVATPGRLIDFCEKREVFLDQLEFLVIDEADRMLDMGFIPQVKRIERLAPRKQHRQTLLFSATFSDDILRLSQQWMFEPSKIEIESDSVATDTVEQTMYMLASDEKLNVLSNLLDIEDVKNVIVFANRRDECRRLHERLQKKGFTVGILSGDVAQVKRTKTLEAFRKGKLKALVATDVAGRGIHIDDVSHVINYTLPDEPEDYVHRIGRTGRAGKTGQSISFVCEDDAFRLPAIEELLEQKLECVHPPEYLLNS